MPPLRLSKWKRLCLILCFPILLYNGPRGGVVHAQVQSQTKERLSDADGTTIQMDDGV